ncbi:MAG TPA: radical SAM protein [Candidatus Omnitrophota bacterium]|nr:radical SAM protein [Candidatus Omnitrophota bacterium]HPT07808.1 radical SAM protein [Candidatus Omnitrophota bacterium]
MKITILIPPVLDKTAAVDRCFGCNYSIYFLPLLPALYIGTILKSLVESVEIIDFPAQKKNEKDFREFLKKDNSGVYIFYTVFLSQQTDLMARSIIRMLCPNARFIFTGPQASFAPESFLDQSDTFAVRGEPEFIVKDLVNSIKAGMQPIEIKGVSFLNEGKIIHNPASPVIANLDDIPLPDRSLLDHRPYYNPKLQGMPQTGMLTSRGCFGQCWFCVPNSLSYARELEYKKMHGVKPPGRVYSAQRVIAEFKDIRDRGFKAVSIIDDQFIWDEKRTLEICRGITGFGIAWSCLCRPEKITDEVACAMKKAGCVYVDMGTESLDQDVLLAIKKDMTPSDTQRAVEILKRNDIEVEINVLLGASDKETEGTIKRTIAQVKKLDADYVLFSIANPFPGTDFYEAAKSRGWLVYGKYVPVDPAKNSIISYPHLSKKKLESLCAYAYLSYYFTPRYIARQLCRVKSFADFFNKASTAIRFFFKNFLTP